MLEECLTGTHGHAVVLGEDEIDGVVVAGIFVHDMIAAGLGPVALQGSHQLNAGEGLQGIGEPLVALDGWRRSFEAHNLQHTSPTLQLRSDILAHDTPHLVVVGADESSELL